MRTVCFKALGPLSLDSRDTKSRKIRKERVQASPPCVEEVHHAFLLEAVGQAFSQQVGEVAAGQLRAQELLVGLLSLPRWVRSASRTVR